MRQAPRCLLATDMVTEGEQRLRRRTWGGREVERGQVSEEEAQSQAGWVVDRGMDVGVWEWTRGKNKKITKKREVDNTSKSRMIWLMEGDRDSKGQRGNMSG